MWTGVPSTCESVRPVHGRAGVGPAGSHASHQTVWDRSRKPLRRCGGRTHFGKWARRGRETAGTCTIIVTGRCAARFEWWAQTRAAARRFALIE